MKFRVLVLLNNDEFKLVGYVDADTYDKAIAKLNICHSVATSTGLMVSYNGLDYAIVRIDETHDTLGVKEFTNGHQLTMAIRDLKGHSLLHVTGYETPPEGKK